MCQQVFNTSQQNPTKEKKGKEIKRKKEYIHTLQKDFFVCKQYSKAENIFNPLQSKVFQKENRAAANVFHFNDF